MAIKYPYIKKLLLSLVLVLMCGVTAMAQVKAGSNGLTIKAGTIFSYSSLVLTPSADVGLSNNTITQTPVADTLHGVNSILERFSFTTAFTFSGAVRLYYKSSQLNGNQATRLQLMYSSSSTGANKVVTTNTDNTIDKYVEASVNNVKLYHVTAISNATPVITVSGYLTSLTTTYGTASTVTSFTMSGVRMAAGILVTAPNGYEVSTSATTGFAQALTVGAAGTIPVTRVYERLAAGTPVGTYSGNILLTSAGAPNGGITTHTGTVTVPDPKLSQLKVSTGSLNPKFSADSLNYNLPVPKGKTFIILTPATKSTGATITVNGTVVASGTASAQIPLQPGSNTLTVVISQGGVSRTYTVIATLPASTTVHSIAATESVTIYGELSAGAPQVKPGISPNGDGINDVLVITNIEKYPDNKFTVVDRNGANVYKVSGYDNRGKAYAGISNINGKQQPDGTYFYQLLYKVNGLMKSETGYIVVKR